MQIFGQSILPFIAIMLILVIVHEAGHYFTAKLFGVKVLEAGVGLPPRIWGFKWRDTDYTINALPIGAFVRMRGEEDPESPDSLAAQPKWKRTIIIGAGAFMNLVLAIVLFAFGLMIPHDVSEGGAQITSVAPDSPAQQADLRPGDQIYEVNGRRAESTQDASYLIRLYQGSTIDMTIKRDDPRTGSSDLVEKEVYARWDPPEYTDECGVEHPQGPTGIMIGAVSVQPVSLTPEDRADLEDANRRAFKEYRDEISPDAPSWCYGGSGFGFASLAQEECDGLSDERRQHAQELKQELFPNSEYPCYEFRPGPATEVITRSESLPPWEALPEGPRMSFESLILARNQIWSWIRGFQDPQVAGPVGIAQATGEVVDQAGWLSLINFAALLSMNLAVLNVLPLPMFDGGRLAFIVIEFLRGGRRIAPQKEALVHLVGLVAIISLAVVITYFDLVRVLNGDSLLR